MGASKSATRSADSHLAGLHPPARLRHFLEENTSERFKGEAGPLKEPLHAKLIRKGKAFLYLEAEGPSLWTQVCKFVLTLDKESALPQALAFMDTVDRQGRLLRLVFYETRGP